MKRHFIIIMAAVLGLFAATACVETLEESGALGNLSISVVDEEGLATKASGVDKLTGEFAAKDAQVFLFDNNGNLYRKIDITGGTGESLSKTENSIKVGTYTVAVVLNGLASSFTDLSGIKTLAELQRTAVTLATSIPANQFTMYGEQGQVTVQSGKTATATVGVKRFVSRIRLVSVKNNLPVAYGALTVNEVFVINALSTWNLAGSGAADGKFNWAGREEGKSSNSGNIIDAAADCGLAGAAYGTQTFASVSKSVAAAATENIGNAFYVYPNGTADDKGSTESFNGPMALSQAAPTRLVVAATINGAKYYYPVTVPGMARNNTYDIALTIKGFGSDDPNKEVLMGNMSVTINVDPWTGGSELTPSI